MPRIRSLQAKAFVGLAWLTLILGLLLFLSAGTLAFWQGWLFLIAFMGSNAWITLLMLRSSPDLVQRRLNGVPWAEKQRGQQAVQWLASLSFIALIVIPSLDRRFGWSHLSAYIPMAGLMLLTVAMRIVFLTFKENRFASATIELAEAQCVISTGPYRIIRHPMYAGAALLTLGIPLALGSAWALVVWPAMVVAGTYRLVLEERFLRANLPGYADYCNTTPNRVIPGLF